MKPFVLSITLTLLVLNLPGQNLDHLMTRRYINCQDIEYNSSFLIPDYYRKGQTDSLNYVLDYWEKRCGYNNVIFQTKILLDIEQEKFNEQNIDKTWINRLAGIGQYRRPYGFSPYNWRYFEGIYSHGLMQDFLDSLSNKLASRDYSESENFLVRFFTGKAKLSELEEVYPNSKLTKYYSQYRDSITRLPTFTMSVYTGLFIPTQSASVLGNHGFIGIGMGGIFYKNSIDLLLDFKFGPLKESYAVSYNDSLVNAEKFTGMYVGLEYGRTIYKTNKSDFLISAGLGGERITAVNKDEEKDIDPKFLWSTAYSIGLGYRYRYNYKNNLAVQFRYQYLDFNNPSGTTLRGNSFTIRLILFLSSSYMGNTLSQL